MRHSTRWPVRRVRLIHSAKAAEKVAAVVTRLIPEPAALRLRPPNAIKDRHAAA